MNHLRIALVSTIALLVTAFGGPATAQQRPGPSPQAQVLTPQPASKTQGQVAPVVFKPASLKQVFVPGLQASVKFVHRKSMQDRVIPSRIFHLPRADLPPVALPVDNTGGQTVPCPIDGNDQYGDCGEAMAAHADNIYTYRCGKGTASVFNQTSLIAQYLAVSDGDNGLSEGDVVNKIWRVGIAGNAQATIVDSLDIDITNVPLAQYALYNFGTIQMAWSVPDAFIQQFATGVQFLSPGIPDPSNGHFTPVSDIDANGNYSLWTWGSYCWVSPSFIASVQPQSFIVFSARSFDANGYDAKGRHITTQAAAWVACGGNPIPQAVIAAFPPAVTPTPAPTPTPTPSPSPTPTPVNPPAPPNPAPAPSPVSSPLVITVSSPGAPMISIAVPSGASISIAPGTLTISGAQAITITIPAGASISIAPDSASRSSGSTRKPTPSVTWETHGKRIRQDRAA